jgi:hypothetical protein
MGNLTFIRIMAGVASALLFASATTGALFALPLFYLTPLPLFLVGLGWGTTSAAIAGLGASVLAALVLGGLVGLGYLVTFAIPAILLTYLALLCRQPDGQAAAAAGSDGQAQLEWYPPGKLVGWITVMAGVLTALAIPLLGFDAETYYANLQEIMENTLLKDLETAAPEGFDTQQMSQLIAFLARALPAISAAIWILAMVFNMWVAGRVTAYAGHPLRPWPKISEITYPREFAIGFVASLFASMVPGIIGIIAIGFAGAFVMAYVLLGLVVIHVLSRLSPFRPFILGSVYIGLIFFGWIALIVATIGMADPIFKLRERFYAKRPPQAPGAE